MLDKCCAIYVINLLHRDDRLAHIKKETKALKWDNVIIKRFLKNDEDPCMGLIQNVRICLEEYFQKHCDRPILILEDDAMLIPDNIRFLEHIVQFINQSPDHTWDTIRLGYSKPIYRKQVEGYPELYWGNCSYTTAVIYSRPFAESLITLLQNPPKQYHYDHLLAKSTPRNILTWNNVFTQVSLPSDNTWFYSRSIQKRFAKHPSEYIQKYVIIGQRVMNIVIIPFTIKYYILMMIYHKPQHVLGWNPKINYSMI